jgi:hypothetical protein
MAKFQYTLSEDDEDRAYITVDDVFDIHILRTEEGLIIDVYDSGGDDSDSLGTIAIPDDSLTRNREE